MRTYRTKKGQLNEVPRVFRESEIDPAELERMGIREDPRAEIQRADRQEKAYLAALRVRRLRKKAKPEEGSSTARKNDAVE